MRECSGRKKVTFTQHKVQQRDTDMARLHRENPFCNTLHMAYVSVDEVGFCEFLGDQPCYRMTWVRGTPPRVRQSFLLLALEYRSCDDRILVHLSQARARHSACLLGLNYCIFGKFAKRPAQRSPEARDIAEVGLLAGGTDGSNFLNDIVLLDTENMT